MYMDKMTFKMYIYFPCFCVQLIYNYHYYFTSINLLHNATTVFTFCCLDELYQRFSNDETYSIYRSVYQQQTGFFWQLIYLATLFCANCNLLCCEEYHQAGDRSTGLCCFVKYVVKYNLGE